MHTELMLTKAFCCCHFNTLLLRTQFDTVNEFAFTGVDQHPTHVHVNHMQLQGEPGNFPETPNWLQAGDWYDTIAQVCYYQSMYSVNIISSKL
jgi:hypothetical protein